MKKVQKIRNVLRWLIIQRIKSFREDLVFFHLRAFSCMCVCVCNIYIYIYSYVISNACFFLEKIPGNWDNAFFAADERYCRYFVIGECCKHLRVYHFF